jgi:heme exporter protein C
LSQCANQRRLVAAARGSNQGASFMTPSLSPSTQEPLVARNRFGFFKYAAPQSFYPLAGRMAPWFGVLAVLFGVAGLYVGFFAAPTDAQQGEVYRVIFIHVPAAWMSMFLYVVMAFWAGVGLAFNTRLSGMMASAIAPTGALFTFIALWTGSLWGKPTWGTWWVWDARLTSELILLFLYFGFLGLHAAIDDWRRADRACAVLALVGVVNIPIIYFSVQWWNTLHQGASVSFSKAPTMAATMLTGMLLMVFAFWMYSIAVVLVRVRAIILERERRADWVKEYIRG